MNNSAASTRIYPALLLQPYRFTAQLPRQTMLARTLPARERQALVDALVFVSFFMAIFEA
jgi:hypothetical protein